MPLNEAQRELKVNGSRSGFHCVPWMIYGQRTQQVNRNKLNSICFHPKQKKKPATTTMKPLENFHFNLIEPRHNAVAVIAACCSLFVGGCRGFNEKKSNGREMRHFLFPFSVISK